MAGEPFRVRPLSDNAAREGGVSRRIRRTALGKVGAAVGAYTDIADALRTISVDP